MATTLEPKWLSIREAARRACVTERTIRNWSAAGMLDLRRVCAPGASKGVVRLDREQLDRLIETASTLPAVLAMNIAATTEPADRRLLRGRRWHKGDR